LELWQLFADSRFGLALCQQPAEALTAQLVEQLAAERAALAELAQIQAARA
jgi:hypothetical protein